MEIGTVIKLVEREKLNSCAGCVFEKDHDCPHKLCGNGRFIEVRLDPYHCPLAS